MTLPPRQAQVLAFLRSFVAEHGYAPSLREIGDHLGVRSLNTVHDHLHALERKGCIVRDGLKSRALRLVEPAPLDRFTDAELHAELVRRAQARSVA